MTDTPVSPLRRLMIEDMTIRKFAPKTQASYIRAVKNFTAFLGRSPDQASAEDLRRSSALGRQRRIGAQPERSGGSAVVAARPCRRSSTGRHRLGSTPHRRTLLLVIPAYAPPQSPSPRYSVPIGDRLTWSELGRSSPPATTGNTTIPIARRHRANLARGFLPC
jgi:hypothetical protein